MPADMQSMPIPRWTTDQINESFCRAGYEERNVQGSLPLDWHITHTLILINATLIMRLL